jgi:uncharacterized lipoprotein YajG
MRLTLGFLAALCLMAGCSFSPPKAPQYKGEFRPVNAPAPQNAALSISNEDKVVLRTKEAGHAYQG